MDQRFFRRKPNGEEMEEEICARGRHSPVNQARPPAKGQCAHDVMVSLNVVATWMEAIHVAKQHKATDQCKTRQK